MENISAEIRNCKNDSAESRNYKNSAETENCKNISAEIKNCKNMFQLKLRIVKKLNQIFDETFLPFSYSVLIVTYCRPICILKEKSKVVFALAPSS